MSLINNSSIGDIKNENFKKKAFFNSIASTTDFISKVGTKFFVSPIILSILGSSLFGIWQIIEQLVGYTKTADVRATQVLKWSISKKRFTNTKHQLREELTAALYLTLLWIPIFLAIGLIITWYSPYITGVSESKYDLIRTVTSLMVASIILLKIFDLFESVLRGLNIGYKLFGVRAGLVISGGILQVVALKLDYGLVGLATVQVLVTILTGIVFYYVVKKNVPWFKTVPIKFQKIKSYTKLSSWYIAFTFTKLIVYNSDRVLLGYLAGPILVTKYVLTQYVAQSILGLISNVINGIIPGLGSLLGTKDYQKVNKGRNYIIIYSLLISIPLSIVYILYNQTFITLWVGQENYAGNVEALLIIVVVLQFIIAGNDESIIKTTLDIKKIFVLNLSVSVVMITLFFILVPLFNIVGLLISIFVSRSILTIYYPLYLRKKYKLHIETKMRKLFGSIILLSIAYFLSSYLALSWFQLLLTCFITGIISFILSFYVLLTRSERKLIMEDAKKII